MLWIYYKKGGEKRMKINENNTRKEEELREQVRDFIEWLQGQGII